MQVLLRMFPYRNPFYTSIQVVIILQKKNRLLNSIKKIVFHR